MARPEHLNRKADLSGASLSEADLRGADLVSADLNRANLTHADFEGADLRKANLSNANLSNSDLIDADLGDADLSEADLIGADLSGASLSGADLSGANLWGATLINAYLRSVFFDRRTTLGSVAFSDGESKSASVADVSWGGVNLAVVDWESVKLLGDEYKARDSKDLSDYQSAVRANRQLAVVLREQGLNEQADHFAYRAQLLQRVVWRKQRRPLKYLFSLILDLLAGYGYRPGRTVLWYLFVIVSFAVAYFAVGHLPPFPDALVFSLMSFHGRGFFPSLSSETSLHNQVVEIAAIEAVVGLLIEISFIATFTQRFFGR